MCGFSGLWELEINSTSIKENISKMTSRLVHRGPDDRGIWFDRLTGIALGHQRLAILDSSDAGQQPMKSNNKRYIIVFNGEIYNHLCIREELEQDKGDLEPYNWRGHSDTETILAAIELWGIEKALEKFSGMFAFALWDTHEKSLYLARDRIGEKPLYYGQHGRTFIFSSELKSLKENNKFIPEINTLSVSLFLKYGYIPSPHSIYKNIHKIVPGTFIKITKDDLKNSKKPEIKKYWDYKDVISSKNINKIKQKKESEIIEDIDEYLNKIIKLQSKSDQPLGVFLSGGIDSSIIASILQEQSKEPIKTFSIGFKEAGYDEAPAAALVSDYIGTNHTELYVSANDALSVINHITEIYDEPFADISQIPTYLLSKLASEKVKVCLSGDGGDEVFGGYNRHLKLPKVWRKISWIPIKLRKIVSKIIIKILPKIKKIKTRYKRTPITENFIYKLEILSKIIKAKTYFEMYEIAISKWQKNEKILNDIKLKKVKPIENSKHVENLMSLEENIMYWDLISYLPDGVLTKVDRASMSNSLEVRAPFLDHKLIKYASEIPIKLKIRKNKGKWILRKLLETYIPENLIRTNKSGFSVPIDEWLRGELKEWADKLLESEKIKTQGFFNSELIQKKWNEHKNNLKNNGKEIWCILIFQMWLEKQNIN